MKWYLATAILLLNSCHAANPSLLGKKTNSKNIEQKTAGSNKKADSAKPDSESVLGRHGTAIKASYRVSVDAMLNKICKGEIQFDLSITPQDNAQLFDIPAGDMKCAGGLLGTFNIAEILVALAGGEKDSTKVVVRNSAIYLESLRQTSFSQPYRPFLPSFIAGKPEELKVLDVKETIDATHIASKKTSSGTSHLKVINFDIPLASEQLGVTLPKTMKFRLENSGFTDYEDRLGAMMFDVVEMEISLHPVAIISMHLQTKMKDLMQVGDRIGEFTGGKISKLLIGNVNVTIDMDLTEQQNLREQIAAMQSNVQE